MGNVDQVRLKPLWRCDMEELAAYHAHREATGGVLFARSVAEREQKDLARQSILDLFAPTAWRGHLSILTMPGLGWRFERLLLGSREPGWMHKLVFPRWTRINSVENDRAIYYGAISKMPGIDTRDALVQIRTPPSFGEQAVKTKFVKRFYFANVDDLMREAPGRWDAVWLDYTGPMTVERLKLIQQFYHRSVGAILIVTVLKARWNRETSTAITRAGGHSEWLRKHLSGEVLHDLEYMDTSPMAQFAVRKEAA